MTRLQQHLRDKNLALLTPEDIAREVEYLDKKETLLLIGELPKRELSEVFYYMDKEVRVRFLETLMELKDLDFIKEMDSDQLTDILKEFPANIVSHLIGHIPHKRREEINKLLQFEDESVGSLMSVDFIKLYEGTTKTKFLELMKEYRGPSETVNQLYVVSEHRTLVGYIDTPDILRHENEDLSSIIQRDLITAHVHMDQEEAAKLFTDYHLVTLPVVDQEKRLVGVISADDIFEVIEEEIYEDMAAIQGMSLSEEEYLDTPAWKLFKERIKWLLILLITATFTGVVIKRYDEVLAANALLAAYIPMLMDSGGNSGSQSSTTIIRAMSTGEVSAKDWKAVLFKEGKVGLMVGVILMLVNFIRVLLMDSVGLTVAIIVSMTLAFTVVLAKIIGAVLPMVAEYFKQDPAVMTGPLLTTVVDTMALLVYFEVSSMFLNL